MNLRKLVWWLLIVGIVSLVVGLVVGVVSFDPAMWAMHSN